MGGIGWIVVSTGRSTCCLLSRAEHGARAATGTSQLDVCGCSQPHPTDAAAAAAADTAVPLFHISLHRR